MEYKRCQLSSPLLLFIPGYSKIEKCHALSFCKKYQKGNCFSFFFWALSCISAQPSSALPIPGAFLTHLAAARSLFTHMTATETKLVRQRVL